MNKLKEGDVVIIHWPDAEHELGIVAGCTDSYFAVLIQLGHYNSFVSRGILEKIGTLI